VFCGRMPVTEEHIFSRRWLEKISQPGAGEPWIHRHRRGGDDGFDKWWQHHEGDLVVRRVCERCNNGWMAELDSRAEWLTIPMARGEPVRLGTAKDVLLLGAWVTKLAMMFDFRQSPPVVHPDAHKAFYDARKPPRNAWIWLAASPPSHPLDASGLTWMLVEREQVIGYLVTIRANHLVAQFMLPRHRFVRSPERPEFSDATERLWPLTFTAITWPPKQVLNPIDFALFGQPWIGEKPSSGS
jgi:hypothetical protein